MRSRWGGSRGAQCVWNTAGAECIHPSATFVDLQHIERRLMLHGYFPTTSNSSQLSGSASSNSARQHSGGGCIPGWERWPTGVIVRSGQQGDGDAPPARIETRTPRRVPQGREALRTERRSEQERRPGRGDSNLPYQRLYFFDSRRAPDAAVLTPLGEPAGGLAAQSSTVIYRPQSLVSSSDTRPPRQPRIRGYVRPALLPRTSDARFSTGNSGGERRQPWRRPR